MTNTDSRAVFFDRDGTLNWDPGYIRKAEDLELLPGVGEALSRLKENGFQLIVVTNQSGVARGLIEPKSLEEIHQRMNKLLEPWKVSIDHFQVCTHHPDTNCDCRKPKPQLILEAAEKWGFRLEKSYMVGDRLKDLQAGRGAGCRGVALVRTGEGKNTEKTLKPTDVDFIGDSIEDVASWILDQSA